jgi:hypothetical protein
MLDAIEAVLAFLRTSSRDEIEQALQRLRTPPAVDDARDAARYRWLEANANKGIGSGWADYTFRIPECCTYRHSLKEMIDSAMKEQPK